VRYELKENPTHSKNVQRKNRREWECHAACQFLRVLSKIEIETLFILNPYIIIANQNHLLSGRDNMCLYKCSWVQRNCIKLVSYMSIKTILPCLFIFLMPGTVGSSRPTCDVG
jgi:hypothetical protein